MVIIGCLFKYRISSKKKNLHETEEVIKSVFIESIISDTDDLRISVCSRSRFKKKNE